MSSRHLITFDMNTNALKELYHVDSWQNAYFDIRNIFQKHGFENIQGSVYLGSEEVSEAHATIALQEVTATYDWFKPCTSNIKLYRVESDLDAQFIVDGAASIKEAFNAHIERLNKTLLEQGLDRAAINSILESEKLLIPNLEIDTKKLLKKKF